MQNTKLRSNLLQHCKSFRTNGFRWINSRSLAILSVALAVGSFELASAPSVWAAPHKHSGSSAVLSKLSAAIASDPANAPTTVTTFMADHPDMAFKIGKAALADIPKDHGVPNEPLIARTLAAILKFLGPDLKDHDSDAIALFSAAVNALRGDDGTINSGQLKALLAADLPLVLQFDPGLLPELQASLLGEFPDALTAINQAFAMAATPILTPDSYLGRGDNQVGGPRFVNPFPGTSSGSGLNAVTN